METNAAINEPILDFSEIALEEPQDINTQKLRGTLRGFWILNWGLVVLCSISILMFSGIAAAQIVASSPYLDSMALIVQFLPWLILAAFSLKALQQPNGRIPDELTKYLSIFVAASFVVYGTLYYYANHDVLNDKPMSVIVNLFYDLICCAYLRRSEVVRSYFGENATA